MQLYTEHLEYPPMFGALTTELCPLPEVVCVFSCNMPPAFSQNDGDHLRASTLLTQGCCMHLLLPVCAVMQFLA